MQINSDYSDLLRTFNDHGVRYLIVGGYAMAIHDVPRYTKDLDIWIARDPQNAERAHRALAAFGAPLDSLTVGDLCSDDVVFQIGVGPRIDILTSISGVDFESAWTGRVDATYDGIPISAIGREALIANKRAAGREQDSIDVRKLLARGS